MAYPPPPGHASLPAKPPPSNSGPNAKGSGFKPAFTAFAPRAVTSSASANRTNNTTHFSAPPTTSYSAQPSYTTSSQPPYQSTPSYDPAYQSASQNPVIHNPFVPSTASSAESNPYGNFDPDYEAQLQQWQSAYTSKDDKSGYSKTATPTLKSESNSSGATEALKTVQRSGGGKSWTDDSLLEWDPAHFRIFVGNLAGEVTDDSLLKAFAKYPSVQKARVIRDKRTTKSKGFGFVSFANGDEYFQAARDMQGKYIGSHPVLIKRAMTEVRPTAVNHNKGKNKKNKHKDSAGGHGTLDYAGIEKKAPKTKNGLRVLG